MTSRSTDYGRWEDKPPGEVFDEQLRIEYARPNPFDFLAADERPLPPAEGWAPRDSHQQPGGAT